ncbi:hypothetical protein [Pseudoclavibacter sp. RFBA6]|uniref:hypothetical protein n=1 Tax=Pseudoclavibacter sp. RFBA6 TaxID=2080573 RepID=UPI000CE7A14E|nr:hypothetical protein [Pseudoclavibacter sp. RFBA6]PPG39497.1 hypothetical protein C5C17_11950 [Pseudoclavibacter sp. RFBA6]
MSKHLLLESTDQNWKLHVNEDADSLGLRLRAAAKQGNLIEVQALLPSSLEPTIVYVNPAQLGWWAVVDLPDPDEQIG